MKENKNKHSFNKGNSTFYNSAAVVPGTYAHTWYSRPSNTHKQRACSITATLVQSFIIAYHVGTA